MPFKTQYIAIEKTNLFSNLFLDYVSQSSAVKDFYNHHFQKKDFKNYLLETSFENVNRPILAEALYKQANLVSNTTSATLSNIELLKKSTTYTVTTGHQLCLFTGPLYFIYKLISTINLCKTLNQNFNDKQFVPVYWMASEDHDFEEINHANVFGKKVSWSSNQKGSVGDFGTQGLGEVIAELKLILGESNNADELISLFENAYLKQTNLADATRYLVNEVFGEYGIVILDGNDSQLKTLFKDEFKKDIFNNATHTTVNNTIEKLTKNYFAQVSPRPINVFYKDFNIRERIEKQGERYNVLNTEISFSKEELENLIETQPEKLSPNVVLRPLYQQKILPNIAYVGGPGELAYWLEYKDLFKEYIINLPILIPRHFVILLDKTVQNKLGKLSLQTTDIFTDGEELVKQFIKTQHNDINLQETKTQLNTIYASVLEIIAGIDKSLIGTTEAEKQKAINGIGVIEQKINRALKQKSETDINQILAIKEKLFPNAMPQERYDNFSMYYSKFGKDFINILLESLTYNLEDFNYSVLVEE